MQGQTLGLETDAEALALGRYIQEANVTNVYKIWYCNF